MLAPARGRRRRAGSSSSAARHARGRARSRLAFPVIVKPNFEGSLEGHHAGLAWCEDALRAARGRARVARRATRPGVLVEEFIVGRDVTVPFLEAAAPSATASSQPVEYVIDEARRRRAATTSTTTSSRREARPVRVGARAGRAAAQPVLERIQRDSARPSSARSASATSGGSTSALGDDGRDLLPRGQRAPLARAGRGHLRRRARCEGLALRRRARRRSSRAPRRRCGIAEPRGRRGRRSGRARSRVGLHLQREARHAEPGGRTTTRPSTTRRRRSRRSARRSRATGTRSSTSRRPPSCPRVLAATPVDLVFNIAEGLRGREPRGAGAGAAASCSASRTPAPTRPRSPSRSTRRSPSACSAPHGIAHRRTSA